MHKFRYLTLALATSLLLTSSAFALEASDKTRLETTLSTYAAALENADYGAVVNALPPAVIELISQEAKLSPEVIRQSITAQMSSVMSEAVIHSFTMDTSTMTSGETASGMNYAFLPTETVISQAGGEQQNVETTTLAIDQDGVWYLMRIEYPSHYDFVRTAYPEFQDVALPE